MPARGPRFSLIVDEAMQLERPDWPVIEALGEWARRDGTSYRLLVSGAGDDLSLLAEEPQAATDE